MAEGARQTQNITHAVQNRVRHKVIVECHRHRCAAAVAAQIGGDYMETGPRQWQQLMAPAIGQLWKTVQEQDAGSAGFLKPGFENMQRDAVVAVDEARANAVGQCVLTVEDLRVVLAGFGGWQRRWDERCL
jgi:hypothetical protein